MAGTSKVREKFNKLINSKQYKVFNAIHRNFLSIPTLEEENRKLNDLKMAYGFFKKGQILKGITTTAKSSFLNSPYVRLLTTRINTASKYFKKGNISKGIGSTIFGDLVDIPVKEPGLGESLIPVWGSAKSALHDFQTGKWGWGLVNTALAVSDVFLVKSAVTALFKGGVKLAGKFGARNAINFFRRRGFGEANQIFHHWLIENNGKLAKPISKLKFVPEWLKNIKLGKSKLGELKLIPDWVKNQMWNLKPLKIPNKIMKEYGTIVERKKLYGLVSSFVHNNKGYTLTLKNGKKLFVKFDEVFGLLPGLGKKTPAWLQKILYPTERLMRATPAWWKQVLAQSPDKIKKFIDFILPKKNNNEQLLNNDGNKMLNNHKSGSMSLPINREIMSRINNMPLSNTLSQAMGQQRTISVNFNSSGNQPNTGTVNDKIIESLVQEIKRVLQNKANTYNYNYA